MPTFHIHIKGCVQGVGFRPFIYRLAKAYDLKGWVNNGPDGVHIEVNGSDSVIEEFYDQCVHGCSAEARLTNHTLKQVESKTYETFEILSSNDEGGIDMAITPDFALCSRCLTELQDPNNRRHNYPFITCTNCGPRYSMATELPYDRKNTTMHSFTMCEACTDEYHKPLNIRYFSQTNSCETCGIELDLYDHSGTVAKDIKEVIDLVELCLRSGFTVAVKGIGGYLLLCDSTNQEAVTRLRLRKQRPDKPFAVLYPTLESLKGDVHLNNTQNPLLSGPVAPIVIAPLKENPNSGICFDEVASRLNHLGVMLPYAPLLWLLANRFDRPLVATSANLSGSPIVYQDDQAKAELFQFADLVLSHNREIVTPQDDSVLRLIPNDGHVIVRRSRGLAPNYYHNFNLNQNQTVLALGAELKGSFALNAGQNIYTSQYLGRLDSYEAQESYRDTLRHFIQLTKAKPDVVLSDKHPDYFTTTLGQELADQWNIPLYKVQHHEAHFASVLAENELLQTDDSTLGMIWDGTGYGDDGNIWGGEFFDHQAGKITRIHHFDYFPVISGDQMARLPKLSALALTQAHPFLKRHFSEMEWSYYKKAIEKPQHVTSSLGRIFDAVSSILALLHLSTYEGQAALLLEESALDFFENKGWKKVEGYGFELRDSGISLDIALSEMIRKANSGVSVGKLAARFHQTLVDIIDTIAKHGSYKRLVFSGGVFQNALLVGLIKAQLNRKYELFFHKQLSPNDENISFGQFMHYQMLVTRNEKKITTKTTEICV